MSYDSFYYILLFLYYINKKAEPKKRVQLSSYRYNFINQPLL